MTWDGRNLANTVYARPGLRRTRCPVVRTQKPPYQHETTDYHDWRDGSGRCAFCRRTLKETLAPAAEVCAEDGSGAHLARALRNGD